MDPVEDKLRRGFMLIERSGGDSDLLGAALLSIHSALEDHFRATLAAHPDLTAEDRARLGERGTGWLALVTMMQKYGGLSREQRRVILEANDLRQRFAHGAQFDGQVGSLLRYSRFVEQLCGHPGLLNQVLLAQRGARVGSGSSREEQEFVDELDQLGAERAPRAPGGLPLGRFVALLGLIVVLLLVVILYGQPELRRALDPRRLLVALSVLPAPSATPGPTTAPPPTPAPQLARIVGLSGGPGWLHDEPSFDSGTRPIPLSEGMQVTLLDQRQVDSGGGAWRYVSVGGYEGWCPESNLAPIAQDGG